MTKIAFLGGCREVGRSGILIESNNGDKCVLDYGIRFKGDERLPNEISIENLKAIALTHCHVDHSGGIPYLYKKGTVPLYTNPITLDIIQILIKDMLRISNYPYPFGLQELRQLISKSLFLNYNTREKIGEDFYLTLINAGHVPGSASIIVEVDGKTILYTGDINTKPTNLVDPSKTMDVPKIDALIVESTYALKKHPPREELEKNFVEDITIKIENGGKVLIPAFGVARSQEALMILDKYNFQGEIFLDGLAKSVSNIYLEHPDYLKNCNDFKSALRRTKFISRKERPMVKKSNGVIVAPSGMLKGGAAISFLMSFLSDPSSAIYLVGYQVKGSTGRTLLDTGIFKFKKKNRQKITMKAQCDVKYYDFSCHADKNDLHEYINNLKFQSEDSQIFCVHGDNKSTTTLASELSQKGFSSVAPEIGEVFKL